MHKIQIKIEFEYAHRLTKHKGKCHNVHGHSGVATFTLTRDSLDSNGFVMDMGEAKAVLKEWIDANWDHAYIARHDDDILHFLRRQGLKVYSMLGEATAENMAVILMAVCEDLEQNGIKCESVWIQETKTGSACFER